MYKFFFLALFSLAAARAIEEIIPISPCDPRLGVPGAVYTCPYPAFYSTAEARCTWNQPETCISWGDDIHKKPRSVGPDPGGVCAFYDGEGCVGEVVKVIRCPGEKDTWLGNGWGKSLLCVKEGGRDLRG
ncbi:hypothetical protein DE146DRAFT_627929 [Phaeosphaeria sp. MPI-PUGE-AT-0046c]|nr:hypothetical protein DE146DRAFT_627929 [Phaeosphaeria sp. MPI-PUGE-AT-0046c]